MEGKEGVAQPGDAVGSGTWTQPHGSCATFTSHGGSSSGERSCVNVEHVEQWQGAAGRAGNAAGMLAGSDPGV